VPPIIVLTDTSLEVQSRDDNATVLVSTEFGSFENQNWPNKWMVTETVAQYDDRLVHSDTFHTNITMGVSAQETALALTFFYLGSSTVKFSLNVVSPTDLVFENNEVVWKMLALFSAPIISHEEIFDKYKGVTVHKFLMIEAAVLVVIVQNTVEIDGETRNTTHTIEIHDTLAVFSFIFPAFQRTLYFDPHVGTYALVDTTDKSSIFSSSSDSSGSLLYLLSLLSVLVAFVVVVGIITFILFREKMKDNTWEKNVQAISRNSVSNVTIGSEIQGFQRPNKMTKSLVKMGTKLFTSGSSFYAPQKESDELATNQ